MCVDLTKRQWIAVIGFCAAVFNFMLCFAALTACFRNDSVFRSEMTAQGIPTDSLSTFFNGLIGFHFLFEAVAGALLTFMVDWLMKRAGMIPIRTPRKLPKHHLPCPVSEEVYYKPI